MKIIQRYIAVNLTWTTLLSLFVLVSLFAFFTLIDQLDDTGRGSYGTPQAFAYVLLTTPRLAYELFPIAAVIGGMSVLGMLAKNSELDVIRTSGVSQASLALLMIKSSLVLVVLAVIIGELIAPAGEERAQTLRSVSMTEQIALKTRHGFWIRDGNTFINIRRVLPDNRIEEIYLYEFDRENRLHSSIYAERAVYADQQWLMENIQESIISEEKVDQRFLKRAAWESLLNPEMINLLTVKPQYLTLWELAAYINYLKQNVQNTMLYEQAFWTKLVRPVSILAMIVLAVPLIRGHARSVAIGQRVFTGALAGIIFHLGNQISANLGIVYQVHPAVSVMLPTLLLVLLIILLMLRE